MTCFRTMEIVFWISLLIVFYAYAGYGLLLYLYLKIRPAKKHLYNHSFPEVTLVVAAYNEQDFIAEKIANSLSLDYPPDKLSLLFITDGSTDRTPAIIRQYPQITLLHQPERRGKTAALNRAMQKVQTPVVVFTDANTLLNKESIRNIVKHYADEHIGGVAGEKKILNDTQASVAGAGEGIYWKYESFLKKLDFDFHTVVGAAGELFSIRTELFEPLAENVLLDDFIISLKVCQKGYRVAYAPDAYAIETASASMKEEQKRKVRISAGGIQAMVLLKSLLNPFTNPKLFFQYISHRVLRWTLCPLLLPVIFIANAWLVYHGHGLSYTAILVAQCLFYLSAITGWILANKNIKVKLLYIPYYFVFMNASIYMGFFRFMNNSQSVLWEKAARKKLA